MQSFSTTYSLQLALRKRYVWKLMTSCTKRFAWHQECHELYSKRTRNTVNKIHKAKKQDLLGNHQAILRVTGKLVATSWITEFLEYLFLQSSSRIQRVRTRSRSWSRSLRTASTRNPSFRTSARRRRSPSSAKNRRIYSLMNNTEVFELCKNSSKQQCPECNTYWEIGIIYCSCGRNMKSSQRPTDVTPIPGYVIKKNSSRGPKRGPSERQRMCQTAK